MSAHIKTSYSILKKSKITEEKNKKTPMTHAKSPWERIHILALCPFLEVFLCNKKKQMKTCVSFGLLKPLGSNNFRLSKLLNNQLEAWIRSCRFLTD